MAPETPVAMQTKSCGQRGGSLSDGAGIFYGTHLSLTVITALISVSAVFLNSLLIASVARTPSLRRPAILLVCGLAVSDLLTGLVPLPLIIGAHVLKISGDAAQCQADTLYALYDAALVAVLGTSQVQLCLMGFDRYRAVAQPLRYRTTATNRKAVRAAVVSWLVWGSLAVGVAVLVPDPWRLYVNALMGVVFIVVPIVTQLASYKAVRLQNQLIAGVNPQTTAVTLAREKAMLVSLAWTTCNIFGSTFIPTAAFTATFFVKSKIYSNYVVTWSITGSYVSTCINPLIYFRRHAEIRAAAFRLLGW